MTEPMYYSDHNPLALAGCGCAACVMDRDQPRRTPRFERDYDDDDGPTEVDLQIGEWRDE